MSYSSDEFHSRFGENTNLPFLLWIHREYCDEDFHKLVAFVTSRIIARDENIWNEIHILYELGIEVTSFTVADSLLRRAREAYEYAIENGIVEEDDEKKIKK